MVVGNLSPDYNVNPPFASQERIIVVNLYNQRHERRATQVSNIPVSWEELGTRLRNVSDLDKNKKIYADAEFDALTIFEIMKIAANVGIVQFVA